MKKKVLGVILGGLLLLPVVSNAADAQKQLITKTGQLLDPVKISGCGRILPANCSWFC